MLIINVHKTMSLVHHMLLAASRISKHLATEKTEISKLDSFSYIGEESLQRGHTINVEDVERVLLSHVI
jgi:hypothetical protein